MFFLFFFFSSRRRHTRSLCDWSSDVCSSDLTDPALHEALQRRNDGSPPPFDGIAELWFDALPGRERGAAAQQAARELLEDERNFIDLPNSPIWYGEEWEVVAR